MCHQSSHTTYTKKWSCRYVIYTQNYISCTRAGFAHVVIPENKASIHIMYNNVSLLRPHLDYKVALRLHFMLLTHGLPCTVVNNSRNKHRAETDRPALYNKNKPSQFRVKSPCLQRNVPAKKNSREHCFTKCAGKKKQTKKNLKSNKCSLCTVLSNVNSIAQMHRFNATRYVQIMFTAKAWELHLRSF